MIISDWLYFQIKFAPYFHQISANWSLKMLLFMLVLMLLTKFVPFLEGAFPASINYNPTSAPNIMQKGAFQHTNRKLLQIRCQ